MSPIKRTKPQEASPILNRVQSGRIGQSPSKRRYSQNNRGKELFPATMNKGKELFPEMMNANKELFPEAFPELPVGVGAPLMTSNSPTKPAQSSRAGRSLSESAKNPEPFFKRSRKPNRGRTFSAVQALNLEQRRAKQVRDSTTKRLQALQFDQDFLVDDARDAKTTPYAAARLDLVSDTSPTKSKKLNFSVALGFWGYKPSFTPIKVFSLSMERFSDVQGFESLILANKDVQQAIAEVGVDVDQLAFVGYEMSFPKGYRYVQGDAINHVQGHAIPFQTVPSDRYALVNTNCALKEFFWQAERYASDEEGNVLVQVTARVAMCSTQPNGETTFEMLDTDWRNDEEKEREADERLRNLEKQTFVCGPEKKELKERMKGIEERARKAMEEAMARKELDKANAALEQLAINPGDASQLSTHSSETEMKDSGMNEAN